MYYVMTNDRKSIEKLKYKIGNFFFQYSISPNVVM